MVSSMRSIASAVTRNALSTVIPLQMVAWLRPPCPWSNDALSGREPTRPDSACATTRTGEVHACGYRAGHAAEAGSDRG